MDEILLHHADLPADAGNVLDALPRDIEPGWAGKVAGRGPQARLGTLLGFALLLDCARAAGQRPPAPGELYAAPGGKPCWANGPSFSISHAGRRVACALGAGGDVLGLDVEERAAVARTDLRLVATAAELEEFRVAGLVPADIWTAKEAVIKATGSTLAAVGRVVARRDSAHFEGRDYCLCRVDVGEEFSCTVATRVPRRVAVARVDARRVLALLG